MAPRSTSDLDGEDDSPLDKTQMAAIWFNQLTQGIYITLPYTLAVYMVRHFEGESGTEESIGRNTGLLAATASAAQCMTSFLWGAISDYTGRKPVLMVGNISACLSILALGLAPNYNVAILSRFIGGLFTSSTGVAVKTIIAESCDATNQAKAMGYMTAGWGVGTIAGPTIGGFLANPCDGFASSWSACESGGWLQERPFLLPCLVSAVMAFLAWMSNLFMMSETHPRFTSKYTKLADSDIDPSSPGPKALAAQTSGPQELQMSSLQHHKGQKQSPKQQQHVQIAETDSAESSNFDSEQQQQQSGSPGQSSRKYVQFATSQSATQESQLQLTVSSSSSSSSGILAVRSASLPLDTQQGIQEDESGSQHTPRFAQRAQRAPSFELVLPDAGMESDIGAFPASLEVAAEKVSRHSRPCQAASPMLQISPSDLSPRNSSSAILDTVSEVESEAEHLLPNRDQRSSQDSSEYGRDHVVNIDLAEDAAKPWYKQNIVTVCLAGGGLITLFMNYLDELAPIFASAKPAAGGLGMPEHQFAWPLTFGGLVLMLYSLLLYPKNQKRWGYRKCCKMGLLLSIPSSLILPFAHTFVQTPWATQACMFVGIAVRSIAKIMALSSSTIIINTVAPMKQIGSVNGASQTLNALARAIGPFIAGIVWGLCADSGVPGKQYIPFLGSIVGVVATDILYMYIVLPS